MKALHFGAGNIGRGFIGKLLADAGIELVFADVNQTVLDALNARHEYPVHVVGEQAKTETVKGVSAVNSTSDEIITLVSEVDLVTTAVGRRFWSVLPAVWLKAWQNAVTTAIPAR